MENMNKLPKKKSKAGRKPKLTVKTIPKATKLIVEHGVFNISNLATALGVSWWTCKQWLVKNPELLELMDEVNNQLIDAAENTIYSAINEGDVFTAKWLLSVRDKRYKEKAEVEHKGDININITDAGDKKK